MAEYTVANLKGDVEDQAVSFGLSPNVEARFSREALQMEKSGLSYQRLGPNFRFPWGHRHHEQEEVYVVVSGSGRAKLDDEIVELSTWDALRVPSETWRSFEAGDDGMEMVVFGAPHVGPPDSAPRKDVEMEQDWWKD
jgi:mannose-6-phosphate isomerase-like protein (cupin superfamily)